jgi:polyhydroxyalkanoate synthesis regulator phasin
MDEPAEPGQTPRRDLAEEILLAALGAVSLTRERASEVADELVRRGKLTRDEARQLADELVSGPKEDGKRLTERAGRTLASVFRELGLVTERRHDELELRVAQLEHRLRLIEQRRTDT